LNAKINAFLSSKNYKFAIAVKVILLKFGVLNSFSDVTIITALLGHGVYVIVDGNQNGMIKCIPA